MLIANTYLVFLVNLLAGVVFGVVLYRGDYCMAGMFRDAFLFRDFTLLRSLYLLVTVSMVLFFTARLAGLLPFYPPPPYSGPSLMGLAGGFIFGVGMVLAGGCVVGTLYKMASGNLANLIGFFGIITGSLLYAEVHPFFSHLYKTYQIGRYITLYDLSPGIEAAFTGVFVLFSLIVFLRWKKKGIWDVKAYAVGYLKPWKAGVIIALLNLLVYILSGWPMGITTGYAKIGAYFEKALWPSHYARISYFQSPSVRVDTGNVVLEGGASARFDIITASEVSLIIGVILGAFLISLFYREFRVYGLPPLRQTISAFTGGMMIAVGARVASGCNVKFVLGGLGILSFQALLFVPAVTIGAYLGAIILKKVVIKV